MQNYHVRKVLSRTINFELPRMLCFKNAFPLVSERDRYILDSLIAAANAVGEPDIVERLLSNDDEYHRQMSRIVSFSLDCTVVCFLTFISIFLYTQPTCRRICMTAAAVCATAY